MDNKRSFADGSVMPDYNPGNSLHRTDFKPRIAFREHSSDVDYSKLPEVDDSSDPVEYRGRVHSSETNDAEALADIWGVLMDSEPTSGALAVRFMKFVEDNFGSDVLTSLTMRSQGRFQGLEERAFEEETVTYRRYAFGHTGV